MALKIAVAYKDNLLSYETNVDKVGLIEPGLYRGYDAISLSSLVPSGLRIGVTLSHDLTGVRRALKVASSLTAPTGLVISRQGFVITEDSAREVVIDFNTGNPGFRYDALLIQHLYLASQGGEPPTFQVIKNVPASYSQADLPNAANQILIGLIKVPPEAASFPGLKWIRAKTPYLANDPHVFPLTDGPEESAVSWNDFLFEGNFLIAGAYTDGPSLPTETFLLHVKGPANFKTQIAYNLTAQGIYYRNCVGGIWTPWCRLLDDRDLSRIDPIGSTKFFSGATAPHFDSTGYGKVGSPWVGWALMNGRNGTPDARGRFFIGLANNDAANYPYANAVSNSEKNRTEYQTLNNIGGENTHQLTIPELPASPPPFTGGFNKMMSADGTNTVRDLSTLDNSGGGEPNLLATQAFPNLGSGTPHNNIPPYLVIAPVMRVSLSITGTSYDGPVEKFVGAPVCVQTPPRSNSLTRKKVQDDNTLSSTYGKYKKLVDEDGVMTVNWVTLEADGDYFDTGQSDAIACPLPVPSANLLITPNSSGGLYVTLTKNMVENFILTVNYAIRNIITNTVIYTGSIQVSANSLTSGQQTVGVGGLVAGTYYGFYVTGTTPAGYNCTSSGVFTP